MKWKNNLIKFLFGLKAYYKKQNLKINNNIDQEIRKCFLIKKEFLDYLKQFYFFNDYYYELKRNYFDDNDIISEEALPMFLDKLINILPDEYINNTNDYIQLMKDVNDKKLLDIQPTQTEKEKMIYFQNHIIICENLAVLLYNNNELKSIECNYLIINKKIFLIFKHYINIGVLDTKNIFVPISF